MDPFSLTVGIAGLIGLTATTIVSARSYVSGVKHSKDSILMLITELEALQANLANLDAFLRSESARNLTFEPTCVLRTCTMACETSLQGLCKKLSQAGNSKTSKLLWPLSEKEHQKTMQDLRSFAQWMQFALSIDGCSLLSQTSDDVLRVLEGQFESFKTLHKLETVTVQINDAVQDQSRIMQMESNAKMRDCILSWISNIDYAQKHWSIRQPRVEGTGRWLLKHPQFLQWRDQISGSNVLWCHGIEGSGKSVLTSMVIDQFRTLNTQLSVAYFYFDYQDEGQQTPTTVLSSLLKQLVTTMLDIPDSISDAYEKHQNTGTPLSLEELEQLMQDVIQILPQAIIIIDALDECDKSRHRTAFLLLLQRLQQIVNIRLFVTSRENFQDITDVFSSHPQITITAQNFDLQRYMRQEMEIACLDEIIDDAFAKELINEVIAQARGMFLLAILHFQTILKEPTAGAMEDALASLSPSLDSAFEKTISRIQRLPESRRQLGISILMWISHAKRPLTVLELSDALSVKRGQTTNKPNYRPRSNIMLECCQGLVTVDPVVDRIHLAHYSIQEYLMKNSETLFPDADLTLATTGLRYLLFDDFSAGPLADSTDIRHRIHQYPFLPYAAQFWGVHYRGLAPDESMKNLTLTFLNCKNAIACGNQAYQFQKGYRKLYWNVEECLSVTALHICSYFGLDDLLVDILNQGTLSINTATKMGTTPIIKAASKENVSTVRMLLRRGADPYLENWYGNALHCAAEAGISRTIRELVAYGMSPNPCERYSRSPLGCTLDHDRAAAFETLVNLGARIYASDEDDESRLTILQQAELRDCTHIIGLVLKNGWVDRESRLLRT